MWKPSNYKPSIGIHKAAEWDRQTASHLYSPNFIIPLFLKIYRINVNKSTFQLFTWKPCTWSFRLTGQLSGQMLVGTLSVYQPSFWALSYHMRIKIYEFHITFETVQLSYKIDERFLSMQNKRCTLTNGGRTVYCWKSKSLYWLHQYPTKTKV